MFAQSRLSSYGLQQMKHLIILLLLTVASPFMFGQEASFQNRVYPLLKKSPIHLILFTDFDFHPTYVVEQKEGEVTSITTLVSYSPDDTGSISWTHFVTFHLITSKDNDVSIDRVDFRDATPDPPCFIPRQVASVDGVGNLTLRRVSIDSQRLLPHAKQLLQQFPSKIEK